ncbi:uncharacterized protein BDW70DRAFT_163722 [Aspergillus foveolatus]|uniref:uncharacterized protein n=1 Tax=Aspergillus foveolatus TaxID=210207 RepID=UPI003CCCF669
MLPLLAAALLTIGEASARYTANLPAKLTPGPVTADYITPSLDQSDLDSPKLSHSNASTFDWWHFDAIALENTNASVAITFSNGGPAGFPLSYPPTNNSLPGNGTGAAEAHLQEEQEDHALWAHLWITFPDGRQFHHSQRADSARLHGSGDSSVAIWHGVGGWMGSEEGYEVEIGMQQPEKKVNVTGRISMERITPPHSLCSDAANFSTNLALGNQGLGWVGILPDAIAHVDVSVNGEKLMFEGYGYHDKIWSSKPFTSSTKSLTRGRAHLGLYSLLWLSYTPSNSNAQIVSSFLSRDGTTVSAGCEAGSVRINPGTEQTEGGPVSGFQIAFPGAQVSVATDMEESESNGGHVRWVGRARGMLEGNEEEGGAIFERFEY